MMTALSGIVAGVFVYDFIVVHRHLPHKSLRQSCDVTRHDVSAMISHRRTSAVCRLRCRSAVQLISSVVGINSALNWLHSWHLTIHTDHIPFKRIITLLGQIWLMLYVRSSPNYVGLPYVTWSGIHFMYSSNPSPLSAVHSHFCSEELASSK